MTHRGSCHCGRVRFTCDIDLGLGSLRCGCSMCARGRTWLARVQPASLDVERGETALNTYECGDRIRHHFCAVCGITPLVEMDFASGRGLAVNLACLDDVTADDGAVIVTPRDRTPTVTACF